MRRILTSALTVLIAAAMPAAAHAQLPQIPRLPASSSADIQGELNHRIDDARAQVEARLDEVWRASQLIRTSTEQENASDAPTSEAETNPTHQPRQLDADADNDQPQTDNTLPTSDGSTT